MGGVEVYVTDFDTAPLTLIQFYAMQEIARLYPDHKASIAASPKRFAMFDNVVGTRALRPAFFRNHRVSDILPLWNRDAATFATRKRPYHLY